MNIVTVTYPNTEGSWFNEAYYLEKHVGATHDLWKDHLASIELLRGVTGLRGGGAAFHCIAILRFHSAEALQQAFGLPDAAGLSGDVANFTNVTPAMQVNLTIG